MQDYDFSKTYLEKDETPFKKVAEVTVSSYEAFKKCHEEQRIKPTYPEACNIIRDRAMAEIFLSLKDIYAKNKKTIIWAANGHIVKYHFGKNEQSSMGYFLSNKLQHNYAAILLTASRYETYQDWQRPFPGQDKAAPGSFDEWTESFGYDSLFIDFKKLAPNSLVSIGMSEEDFKTYSPLISADGLIYLKRSEPMILVK